MPANQNIPQTERKMVTTNVTGTSHQRLRLHHDCSPGTTFTATTPLTESVLISVANVGPFLQM